MTACSFDASQCGACSMSLAPAWHRLLPKPYRDGSCIHPCGRGVHHSKRIALFVFEVGLQTRTVQIALFVPREKSSAPRKRDFFAGTRSESGIVHPGNYISAAIQHYPLRIAIGHGFHYSTHHGRTEAAAQRSERGRGRSVNPKIAASIRQSGLPKPSSRNIRSTPYPLIVNQRRREKPCGSGRFSPSVPTRCQV